ncbi:Hypothetical protein R9X50_00185500 [Acrodontium crateriforme]|uniref:Mannosyl phosphorylinositol ceramide synthase SUR1 n=1 Tax=Acrodontium crateriforme TaxID=150365 RepID=A0AAQ3M364_9PEZI|nr:Hypothetical protein R9X50_00185500 [Acrodontium crateriforme]
MLVMNRKIRVWKLAAIIFAIVVFCFLTLRISNFIHIFGKHAGDALTQQQVLDAYEINKVDETSAVVPRIIHQIFHNWTDPDHESLPADWNATRQTCLSFNPEWEHLLWTTKSSRAFLEKEYAWFLPTYDNYKLPIQKIDAVRYFLIRHYGGIYIDLDNGCRHSLEPLRYYPAWVTDGGHGALSNNILGGEPQHAFWTLLTDSLNSYAWNYPLPYLTICYSTGQWFETAIWEKFHRRRGNVQPLTRVMMDGRPGKAPWVFFSHSRGGTWDNWDNKLFQWIGEHVGGFILILAVLTISTLAAALPIWKGIRRFYSRSGLVERGRYRPV